MLRSLLVIVKIQILQLNQDKNEEIQGLKWCCLPMVELKIKFEPNNFDKHAFTLSSLHWPRLDCPFFTYSVTLSNGYRREVWNKVLSYPHKVCGFRESNTWWTGMLIYILRTCKFPEIFPQTHRQHVHYILIYLC